MSLGKRPRILCLPTGPDEYAVAVVRALAAVADVTFVLPRRCWPATGTTCRRRCGSPIALAEAP